MKRNSLFFILLLLGAAAVAVVFVLRQPEAPPAAAAAAAAASAPQEVHYASGAPQLDYLKIMPVDVLPAPLVEPMTARVAMDESHTSRVFSPVNGRVLRIFVEPGAAVKKGQPLVEIDSPDYASALSDVRKARADNELKQRALKRQQELFDAGVVARRDLEGSKADYDTAQAELARAEASFRRLSVEGGDASTLTITAPIDGVLASWTVNPGTEVRPDATDPLFIITDMSQLWVVLDAPESALGHLQPGQHVTILSDSDASLREDAVIANLPANVDPTTRRLPVRCLLANKDGKLRPEMYVRAIPYADAAQNMARVPDTALVTNGLYSYVFVQTQPGTLQRRRVHVALQGHGESFVDQGLAVGDKLVVTGALLLDSELHGTGGD